MSKKTVLRIIILALIVIWMIFIFKLSDQNGTTSSNLSREVAKKIVSEEKIDTIEPYIRKIAHLSEYAVRWNIIFLTISNLSIVRYKKNVIFFIDWNRICNY